MLTKQAKVRVRSLSESEQEYWSRQLEAATTAIGRNLALSHWDRSLGYTRLAGPAYKSCDDLPFLQRLLDANRAAFEARLTVISNSHIALAPATLTCVSHTEVPKVRPSLRKRST